MADILTGGWLSGKKTHITAVLGVLAAVGAYLGGDMGLTDALQAAWVGLIAIFMRNGIASK